MTTLNGEQMTFLAGKTALDVYLRAVQMGNYHASDWIRLWAEANTETEEEDDNEKRV